MGGIFFPQSCCNPSRKAPASSVISNFKMGNYIFVYIKLKLSGK